MNASLALMMQETCLKSVECYEYLGIRLGNTLKFVPKIEHIFVARNRKLFILGKIKKIINEKRAVLLQISHYVETQIW